MFFSWDIKVPANTREDTPLERTLRLTLGTIEDVTVYFPLGCAGLVGVRLLRGGFQLVPLSPGEWLTGNFQAVPCKVNYELSSAPAELKLVAVNLDDTFPHTVSVWINLARREVYREEQYQRDLEQLQREVTL